MRSASWPPSPSSVMVWPASACELLGGARVVERRRIHRDALSGVGEHGARELVRVLVVAVHGRRSYTTCIAPIRCKPGTGGRRSASHRHAAHPLPRPARPRARSLRVGRGRRSPTSRRPAVQRRRRSRRARRRRPASDAAQLVTADDLAGRAFVLDEAEVGGAPQGARRPDPDRVRGRPAERAARLQQRERRLHDRGRQADAVRAAGADEMACEDRRSSTRTPGSRACWRPARRSASTATRSR